MAAATVQVINSISSSEPFYSRASQPASKLSWLGACALAATVGGVLHPFHALFRHKLRRRLREIDWAHCMDCGVGEVRISRGSYEISPVDIGRLCDALKTHQNLSRLHATAAPCKNRVVCVMTGMETAFFLSQRTPTSIGYAIPDAQVGIVISDWPTTIFSDSRSYCSAIVETMVHETAHLLINCRGGQTKQGDYLEEMACTYLDDVEDTRLLECIAAYLSGTLPLPSHILQVEKVGEFRLIASAIISLIVDRIGIERFFNAYLMRLSFRYAPLFECFAEAGIESPHSLDAALANYLSNHKDKFEREQVEQLSRYYSMKYAYEVRDLTTALHCSYALSNSRYDLEASIYRACILVKMQRYEEALKHIEVMLESISHPVPQYRLALLGAVVKRLLGSSEDYPNLIRGYSEACPLPARYPKNFEQLETLVRKCEHTCSSIHNPDMLQALFGIPPFLSNNQVPRMVEK